MSKKSDSYCLQNFTECVEYGCQAAKMLEDNLNHFDTGLLQDKLDELHRIEHDADKKKYKVMVMLAKAFITPIEREDITLSNQSTDEVMDRIEDVLTCVYISDVQQTRPEALAFIKIIIRCCEALKEVMREFADFRKSKTLHGLIIGINALEEEGDSPFIDSMRSFHAEVMNPIEIIAWREIYVCLEKCRDACEYAADVVESVIMKNTRCPTAAANARETGPVGYMVLTDRLKSWKSLIFTA